jgi:hypothetical protein
MNHAVRVQREITDPRQLGPSRAKLIWAVILCVPLLGLSVYSWVARPEFIWGPSRQSVAPQRLDADLRFTMFLLAQRVKSHRVASGSYPVSLAAIGGAPAGISLRVLSDSLFELQAMLNGKPVILRSNEPASAFLGTSLKVIAGNPR